MDKDRQIGNNVIAPSFTLEEKSHILLECQQAYLEDVICGDMSYEEFVLNFSGVYGLLNGNKELYQTFKEHQPIIEHRFKSSVFSKDDAMAMLQEFEHCNSFF